MQSRLIEYAGCYFRAYVRIHRSRRESSTRGIKGERVYGAPTVRTVWGNYPAFTPQLDPHRTDVITWAL